MAWPPKSPEPFDELPSELQAEVDRIAREVQALTGGINHYGHATVQKDAGELAKGLAAAFRQSSRDLAASEKCQRSIDRIAEVEAELEEFTTTTRRRLKAATNLLADLQTLVAADERRRAEEGVARARRQRVDAEVDRRIAAEEAAAEAERRERIEAEVRDLEVAG